MNGAQLHLLLNHIPIITVLLSIPIILWGLVQKNEIKRVGLVILLIGAISSVLAFLTGEPAEEVVEKLPGVGESLIEAHEEAGALALGFTIVAGVAAFIGLFLESFKSRYSKIAVGLALLLAIVSGVLLARTGHLGGLIRHEEIRAGTNATQAPNAEPEDEDYN